MTEKIVKIGVREPAEFRQELRNAAVTGEDTLVQHYIEAGVKRWTHPDTLATYFSKRGLAVLNHIVTATTRGNKLYTVDLVSHFKDYKLAELSNLLRTFEVFGLVTWQTDLDTNLQYVTSIVEEIQLVIPIRLT